MRSCIAELFGLVFVTENEKNEGKNQWDDHPEWIEATYSRGVWTRWIGIVTVDDVTVIHLLQNGMQRQKVGGRSRLLARTVALSRSHVLYLRETDMTMRNRNTSRKERIYQGRDETRSVS